MFSNKLFFYATFAFAVFCTSLQASVEEDVYVVLSHNKIKQGGVFKFEVKTPSLIKTANIRFSGRKIDVFYVEIEPKTALYRYVGYVGVGRRFPIKRHSLRFELLFQDGSSYTQRFKVWNEDGVFKKEFISLTKAKKKLARDKSTMSKENKELSSTFKGKTKNRWFKEPFILPVKKGRITSPYGSMRIYNGVPSWSHSGLDIGKRLGASIFASNTGAVVLLGDYKVHGKTIVIDHGHNIFSIYNHLDTFLVELDQVVSRGEEIGKMGATGISTGPHLHWGITVQGVRVNPSVWLGRQFLVD